MKIYDNDQLGQLIRMEGHLLMMGIKNPWEENNEAVKKAGELKTLLEEWEKRNLPEGEDKLWARDVLELYNKWQAEKTPQVNKTVEKYSVRKDITGLINGRASCRFWSGRHVEEEVIRNIIEAGLAAPTAFNRMPVKFYIVRNEQKEISEENTTNKSMLSRAPVKIYLAVDERLYDEKNAPAMDSGCIIMNMSLAAESMGLGTCIFYQCEIINQVELRLFLGAPEYFTIYNVLLLGYPGEEPMKYGRRSFEDSAVFINR